MGPQWNTLVQRSTSTATHDGHCMVSRLGRCEQVPVLGADIASSLWWLCSSISDSHVWWFQGLWSLSTIAKEHFDFKDAELLNWHRDVVRKHSPRRCCLGGPEDAKLGQEAFSRHLRGRKMHFRRKWGQTPKSFLLISLNLRLFSQDFALATCPKTFFRPEKMFKKFMFPKNVLKWDLTV